MITCNKSFLEARCIERGYSLKEAMPCVVSVEGDEWTIDTEHPSYPRHRKTADGPGTKLKYLLGFFGIHATGDCSCNKRAKMMDENGLAWCRENIDLLCEWMGEEAAKRGHYYRKWMGKLLVKTAIKLSEMANRK